MQGKDWLTVIEHIKSKKVFFISLFLIAIFANIGFYWLYKNFDSLDAQLISVSLKVFLIGFALIGLGFKYQRINKK